MISRLAILVLLGLGHCPKRSAGTDSSEADAIANSPLGKYQGSIMKNSFDKPFYAFRGIRYAEPPVGDLRFKPAVPVKKHDRLFDATQDAPACPQPPLGDVPLSEDCLFLNVYSSKLPKENDKERRPVVVFIYPSDFQGYTARSDYAGPEYLMNVDIVLVTFNYRLGVLGFISTGDKEAPGNLGLKDQVEVLKWVKQNIEGFGGDPNSVTIYGVGSGGSCATLHLVSPLSKGLFHKAIISTGAYTGVQAVGKSLLSLTKSQARVVGCPDNSTSSMINCLKKKPADKLGKSIVYLNPFPVGLAVWKPVIEEDFGQERFLTDHPVKLMLEGKFHDVPINMGYNSDQFSFIPIELVKDSEELQKLDQEFDKRAPKLFSFDHDERANSISKELRAFYFGDKKIDNSTLPQLMNLYNDALIGHSMHRAITLLAQKSKNVIYSYHYAWTGKLRFYDPKEGPIPEGPTLDDDLIYIFFISKLVPKVGKEDPEFKAVQGVTCAIAQFAKSGHPNCSKYYSGIEWQPFDLSTKKYLEVKKKPALKEGLYSKRFAEWDKLFPLTKYDIVQDSSPDINICH